MTTSWDWPKRSVVLRDRNTTELFCVDPDGNIGVTSNYNVSAYEAAEDTADNNDYRFFLLFVWIGGLVYLGFFGLGVWKAVQLIGGLV